MKFWPALIFFFMSPVASSGEILLYEDAAPDGELSKRMELTGPVTASIFATPPTGDINLFERSEVYLRVDDEDGSWWVHTPKRYDSMNIIQFVDTSSLLITLSTPVSTWTAKLDLDDKLLHLIGSGIGEVIASHRDDRRIKLTGQRGHSDGVYWYGSITDLQGRIIEFLPGGESCLPISDIVSSDSDLSRLQQPLDYCVGISRL